MTHNAHGVIMAAGNGSRFASAKGIAPPYPKHLEQVRGQTILSRAVESMIRYVETPSITVLINPLLQDEYLKELSHIAQLHPEVEFSYATHTPSEDTLPIYQVATSLENNVQTLDGRTINLQDRPLVLAHGDIFLEGEDDHGVRDVINRLITNTSADQISALYEGGGFVYAVGSLRSLRSQAEQPSTTPFEHAIKLSNYGLELVHVNIPFDLENYEIKHRFLDGENGRM